MRNYDPLVDERERLGRPTADELAAAATPDETAEVALDGLKAEARRLIAAQLDLAATCRDIAVNNLEGLISGLLERAHAVGARSSAHLADAMPGYPALHLDIPDEQWEETGEHEDELDGRLLLDGGLAVNGLPHHVEAWKVRVDEDGEPVDPQEIVAYDDQLDRLHDLYDPGQSFRTATIRGNQYIVVMYPYGS